MTSKGIFRGSRSNGVAWRRPAATRYRGRLAAWPAAWPVTALTRKAVLPVCDAFALLVAALFTVSGWLAVGYAAAVLILLKFRGWQRLRICLRVSDEIAFLAAAAILPIPLFLPFINKGALVSLAALSFCLLATMRLALYSALRAANRRRWLAERVLIVGSGKLATEIGELLERHPELGLRPVGFIASLAPDPAPSLPLLGGVSELPDLVFEYDVSRIIITLPEDDDPALVSVLRTSWQLPAEVCVVPRMHELAAAIPAGCQDEIWGIPVIPLRCSGLRSSGRAVKRAFDVVVGMTLLTVLAPLMLLLMGGLLLACGRPVLFRQARVTGPGRITMITKLRTVAAADPDRCWTVSPGDCTALGRWLRATHLDELPQLLNVVRGEMSLVGPRPERPYFTAQFAEVVPRYEDRHRTNGGMTGWAQVHGLTGDTSIQERTRFDNNYIEHWSLWLDLAILVRTLTEPLSGARRK